MKIFIAAILLFAGSAMADELRIDITTVSHHFNRNAAKRYNLNEVNPGIGIHWIDGDYHKLIGVYHNSFRNTSSYALISWTPIHIGHIKIGPVSGIATGYKKLTKSKIGESIPAIPVAGIYVSFPISAKYDANMMATPAIKAIGIHGVVGLQISAKI